MNETVFIQCPDCGGEGEISNGNAPYEMMYRCRLCNGRGEIEETLVPRTLDDLEDEDAEGMGFWGGFWGGKK